MYRRRIVRSVAVAFLLAAPRGAFAQSALTGAIAGKATDPTGAVLPGVAVEASSPALIEKVRSVVTDGQGEYKIVDLRPGTYTVTFTLTGFSTFKREGIELTTGFTAAVNAEMKLGSLEEAVTVTSASPVVDVYSARTQTVLQREVLDALPTSKSPSALSALVVGGTGRVDVGGAAGDGAGGAWSIHGSRGDAGRAKFDGMPLQGFTLSGGNFIYRPNLVAMQEVNLEAQGVNAENETAGIQLNYVSRDGGNGFHLYGLADYTSRSLIANNITQQIQDRGLTAAAITGVDKVYDYGAGFGGPIRKDRLWFYTAHRWWGVVTAPPNAYFNGSPNPFLYAADLSRPATARTVDRDNSGRVTLQLTPKQRLSINQNYQYNCSCSPNLSSAFSPEAAPWSENPTLLLTRASWSYPLTSRLLFESTYAYNYVHKENPYHDGVTPASIAVNDTGLGVRYGATADGVVASQLYSTPGVGSLDNHGDIRASVAYVTGSHAFKTGLLFVRALSRADRNVNQSLSYTFRNQVPTGLTQWVSPVTQEIRLNNFGLFAQDQWTLRKLTLNLGLRFDYFNGTALAVDRPAARFLAAQHFDAVENVPNWKDINPRIGAAYDLFGNGKTAIKGSIGRYVESMGISLTELGSPQQTLVVSTTRTWNDSFFGPGDPRTANFAPDCDLNNFDVNGECGAINNNKFGTVNFTRRTSADVNSGWGARTYEWNGFVAVQQELWAGTALDVSYFRTSYSNLAFVNNLAVTPADVSTYCVTTPVDSRLPGGGGQRLCDLYDVNLAQFGKVDEVVDKGSKFGNPSVVYNGVDITVRSRLGRGAFLAGGVSFGRTITDNCIATSTPAPGLIADTAAPISTSFQDVAMSGSASNANLDARPGFCRIAPPWSALTLFKMNVAYPLPRWGVQVSAVFQNVPGLQITANRTYSNAEIAPSLLRNLSAGSAANVIIPIIPLGTMYEDRYTQLDLRFAKTVKVGAWRLQPHMDIANALNGSAITAINNSYGANWLRPTTIQVGRMFKFGTTIDF